MQDEHKTREQLMDELVELQRQVAKLKISETERKKVKEDLRVAQKYAQDIINSSIDMIIAVDKNRKIIEFNKTAQKAFGYKLDDIIGKDIDILYNNPKDGLEISKAISKTGKFFGEAINVRKNGDTFPSLISASPLYDTEGNFLGVMGISRDITEQKMAEKELDRYRTHLEELVEERTSELRKTNEKLLQEIIGRMHAEDELIAEKESLTVTLRSIGDGVIATDAKGNITVINNVAETLTGWSEKQAIGMYLNKIYKIVDEKTHECYESIIEKILINRELVDFSNIILVAKDGTERYITSSGSPIHSKDDNIIGVVLVFSDKTEKRKMEKELLKIEKLESIGILAGGIAHDFNNILTAIMGNISFAKSLYSKQKNTKFKHLIVKIGKILHTDVIYKNSKNSLLKTLTEAEKASFRARDLTLQLLTFSKGGMPVLKPSSVEEILKDSTKFALTGSNVGYKFYISDNLWQVKIDEGQISQVLNNMVINANQAMPEGGVIEISSENVIIQEGDVPPLKEGKYIKISIQDHGVGIPEENLPKIFDPFFTTKKTGNGLGLASAYSIINNHDGYISVESKLGVGTAFYIYLPACPEVTIIKERKLDEKPINGEGKVLVMDDEYMIRELACNILSNIGYKAITAKDGIEAIELYKEAIESGCPFNAVILDLTVSGGMGGREAIQRIIEIDPEAKAIVSSGYSDDPVMSDFRKYGFINSLRKPYRVKELSDILRSS
jgi:PAS domain S-box-containing protein